MNIIIPMGGKSSRFNYKFKPFLQLSDKTFIELAFENFYKYNKNINCVYFIFNNNQNIKFNVKNNLENIFKDYSFELKTVILNEETDSQFDTIKNGVIMENIKGACIICDCDHSVDVTPLFDVLNNDNDLDLLLSAYKIKEEEINSWGIIYFNEKNKIMFSEKKIPHNKIQNYLGLIGCNYLKNIELIKDKNFNYLTEYYDYLSKKNYNLSHVIIKKLLCFGTLKKYKDIILKKKKEKTLFCDLDGTLIQHQSNPNYENEILIKDSLNTLNNFKKENKNNKIIITTARTKKKKIINLLNQFKIPFDDVICNLNSGPRILINDVKPSLYFNLQSHSINIIRNKGVKYIDYNKINNNNNIISKLKGGSFSKVLLIEKNNNLYVRKIIFKRENNNKHYDKLKLQKYNLLRFNKYKTNICPKIYEEIDNDCYYYFDMEYLENYKELTKIKDKKFYIRKLSEILEKDIYVMKKKNNDSNWIKDYLKKKIKLNFYESLTENIRKFINLEYVIINGKKYRGLKSLINIIFDEKLNYFNPKFLAPIHGDLTYENIMINTQNNEIKLIDIDGGDFIDAIELDLGKLFQSYLSKYEIWSNDDPIIKLNLKNNIINTKKYYNINIDTDLEIFKNWINILNLKNYEELLKIGIFYMILHLFRMIPFRFKVSEEQTIYTFKEIIFWLNYIFW